MHSIISNFSGLWAIAPDYLDAFLAPFRQGLHTTGLLEEPKKAEPAIDWQTRNGTAIIPVNGVLMRTGPAWFRDYGIEFSSLIADAVQAAAAAPDVDEILLDINSPGGTVNGTPELAVAVQRAAQIKPIAAFSAGLMASAAYWLAAATDNIIVTPSAIIGSIGVLTLHVDASAAYENRGLNVQVFRSAEQKAPGAYNTALTENQAARIQADIDELYGQFLDHVLTNRPDADPDALDGRTINGAQGPAAGLADAVVHSRAEALGQKFSIDPD